MTEAEFNTMQAKMDMQSDMLEAEYEIITKIISQKLHSNENKIESMD